MKNVLIKIISRPLVLILILASIPRVIFLDKIPSGISNDELEFIINAKAFFLTGEVFSTPRAELSHILISPIIGLLNLSLFTARMPYVVISVLLVLLLFLITKRLIGDKEALIVGLVASLNPWSIFFGRTSYEAPLAIFFYLLAFYILLISKRWKILLALIPLILGFYSYMGTKIIFIPIVAIICLYSWLKINNKKYLKQYLILFLGCLLIFFYFITSLVFTPKGTRLSELNPNISEVAEQVNQERRLSIKTPLSNLLSNKPTVLTKRYINKYLDIFSSDIFFLYGDRASGQKFSLWFHGYFYYLDIIFLVVGFIILYKKNPQLWLLLTSLILISPLPSTFRTGPASYALQSSLIFPILIILVGYGISRLLVSRPIYFSKIVLSILLFLYSLQVLNFVNLYFFRFPIYNSEAFDLSSRILSKYIDLNSQKNNNIKIVSQDVDSLFKQHLFYSNLLSSENADDIIRSYRNRVLEYQNFEFLHCSKEFEEDNNFVIVISTGPNCPSKDQQHLTLARLSDGGGIYMIYNDIICSQYKLNRYPSNFRLQTLEVEKLNEKQFCEKFITIL